MSKYYSYKQQVLEISLSLLEGGYFGTKHGSAGNVSVLVSGEEAVVITPSGMNYASLTADDLCVVNFSGGRIEGPHEPSVETGMHLAVYKNRRDVNAVIHTHQIHATMLSIINQPMPALFDEVTVSIGPKVEIVPYGLSGSSDLIDNVTAKLSNRCHCYILQNHGALCVGPSLEKARLFVELLEKQAMVYCQALAMGREITTLPEPMPEGLFQITKAKQDMEIARKESLQPVG
ncbi:MAG: class II aldolase/adducin family protein [Candidatus Hydrogenedentes bacterium]|nr:class II aldolase/adducin family protein [Candidatus Hydrogenedentota bacterium]